MRMMRMVRTNHLVCMHPPPACYRQTNQRRAASRPTLDCTAAKSLILFAQNMQPPHHIQRAAIQRPDSVLTLAAGAVSCCWEGAAEITAGPVAVAAAAAAVVAAAAAAAAAAALATSAAAAAAAAAAANVAGVAAVGFAATAALATPLVVAMACAINEWVGKPPGSFNESEDDCSDDEHKRTNATRPEGPKQQTHTRRRRRFIRNHDTCFAHSYSFVLQRRARSDEPGLASGSLTLARTPAHLGGGGRRGGVLLLLRQLGLGLGRGRGTNRRRAGVCDRRLGSAAEPDADGVHVEAR